MAIPDMEGSLTPPRQNGELLFDAPWQSRAFGMAVALHEQGEYDWSAFSTKLAEQIGADHGGARFMAVSSLAGDSESRYYAAWLAALQRLLVERGIVSDAEIDEMTMQVAAGALDHDH